MTVNHNSLQFIEGYKSVLNANKSMKHVSVIGAYKAKIDSYNRLILDDFITGDSEATYEAFKVTIANLDKIKVKVIDQVISLKPRLFMQGLMDIQAYLKASDLFTDTSAQELIDRKLDMLIDHYTDTYAKKDFSRVFDLTAHASDFHEYISNFTHILNAFSQKILPVQAPLPGTETLEVKILDLNNSSLEDFLIFLNMIDNLYRSLSQIFDEADSLKISKVESGSLFAVFFGKPKIIRLIKKIFFGIGDFIKEYTYGDIDRKRFENKAMKSQILLELIEQAKSANLDQEAISRLNNAFKQSVRSLGNKMGKGVRELAIDNQQVVVVNDEQQKLIEEKKINLISSKSKTGN